MLRGLVTIIILTHSLSGLAQIFEGKVTYKLEIKNADPNLPDSVFKMMYAGAPETTQVYYYRDNNYKSVTEGQPVKSFQIYEPATNRTYGYTDQATDIAFWSEGSSVTTIEKLDVKESIMGIPCSAVLMKTGDSQVTLYFNAKFKVDIKKVKEDNSWEKYLREARAIPLKYIMKGGPAKHYIVLTAIDVKEEKLTADFFNLPKFKQTMKSPF